MASVPVAIPLPRPSFGALKYGLRWISRRVLLIFSVIVLAMLVLTAIFAPLIDRHDPRIGDLDDKNTPPFWMDSIQLEKTVVAGIPEDEQTQISFQKTFNLVTSFKILDLDDNILTRADIWLTKESDIVDGTVIDPSTGEPANAATLAAAGRIQDLEGNTLSAADLRSLGQPEIKQVFVIVSNPDVQIAQSDAQRLADEGSLFDLSGNALTRAEVVPAMDVQIGAGVSAVQVTRAEPLVVQEVRRPAGIGTFPLGTDPQGRDLLSRIIWGARVSLIVAGVTLVVGGTVGVTAGLVSGYFGGWVDEIIMRIVDIVLALPLVLVALVLVVAVPDFVIPFLPQKEVHLIASVLSLFSWVRFARQVRGEVLRLKTMDYIALAKVAGCSNLRILVAHLFPGVLNTVIVVATLQISVVILLESILSFLGAGVPPPTPAWGSMVSEGRNFLRTAWWVSTMPGLALLLTVLAFNLFGDWMRDYLDPRLRNIEV